MIVTIVKVEGRHGYEYYVDHPTRRLTIYLGATERQAAEEFRRLFGYRVSGISEGLLVDVPDVTAERVFYEFGLAPVDF